MKKLESIKAIMKHLSFLCNGRRSWTDQLGPTVEVN